MISEFEELAKDAGIEDNPDANGVELFGILVARRCAELLNAHASQLKDFNFPEKAQTVESCAGIILEHFNARLQ